MPCCNTAIYNRLQGVLCRLCSYITNSAKQRTGLYMGVSVDLAHSSVHNTVTTQANYAPTAPHWRAYHQAQHLQHIPDTNAAPGRCTGQHRPPYYNKVYKSAFLSWIHARRGSIPQIMQAQRGLDTFHARLKPWHRVSLALAWHTSGIMFLSWHSGAEPLAALAASLFGLSPDS